MSGDEPDLSPVREDYRVDSVQQPLPIQKSQRRLYSTLKDKRSPFSRLCMHEARVSILLDSCKKWNLKIISTLPRQPSVHYFGTYSSDQTFFISHYSLHLMSFILNANPYCINSDEAPLSKIQPFFILFPKLNSASTDFDLLEQRETTPPTCPTKN